MELYNVTPAISTFPLGISAAMEEKNAEDPEFDTTSINNVKTAFMGPLSGIGDAMYWELSELLPWAWEFLLPKKEAHWDHCFLADL